MSSKLPKNSGSARQHVSTIMILIFWNFTIFQFRSDSPEVKQSLIFSIRNLIYKYPHELPNDLRLSILKNQEISETSQIWVETYLSDQFAFRKLNFGISNQKLRKRTYQNFLTLPDFTEFIYFVPKILCRIVVYYNCKQIGCYVSFTF